VLAWLLDALAGDPRWVPWPHPVVVIGRCAALLEGRLHTPGLDGRVLALRGLWFWAAVVVCTAATGWMVLGLASRLHPLMGRVVAIYLAYACLATRCLDAEAREVVRRLERGDVAGARQRLSRIVGRDTEGLPRAEISRAAVETVAENASDGVIAPLVFLAAGAGLGLGPLLGLVYKAVNTLDSMVGYRDERYEHFGKVSARLDDAANWVPARLTALLAAVVAQLLWRHGRDSLRVAIRDGRLHKSPNSGFPEAAFAGALGVSLGGTNTYRGVPRHSPRLGDPGPPLEPAHVYQSLRLLWGVSFAGLLVAAGFIRLV